MYYMNKTKRNLIIASAIINIIVCVANLILTIVYNLNIDLQEVYAPYVSLVYSSSIIFTVIELAVGLVGSILLLYSVRQKGKFFRTSQGCYIAGFIIVVICGGYVSWILLFISMFVPDIVVMNRPEEIKKEQKEEVIKERAYEEKKKRIEDLKRMRDNGLITEEEYKEKLFELL